METTMNFKIRMNLGLSKSLVRILSGLNASEAKIVETNSIFWFWMIEIFGLLYISREELAQLYFYLPLGRRNELDGHLNKIAPDFWGWKMFLEMNKYSSEAIKKMALSEMYRRAESFQNLQTGYKLAEGYLEMRGKFLSDMRRQAKTLEEKISVLSYELEPTLIQIEEVFSLINDFSVAEKFIGLPNIPATYKNKGLKKMFKFAVSFPQLLRTHRRSRPGSPLRREIVRAAAEYELKQLELFDAYYSEKTRTALKIMLLTKIEKLVLGIEDWLEILIQYGSDRKLKSLVIKNIRANDCTFSQLNNSVSRIQDPEAKAAGLEEMLDVASYDFSWLRIVCLKSGEFPKVFRRAFTELINTIETATQAEEACELITKNRPFEVSNFFGRIIELGIRFETLERIFFLLSKENKKKMEGALRRAAGDNFNHLGRVVKHCQSRRNRNRTILDMYKLAAQSADQLVCVYQLALSYNQPKLAERVVVDIKKLNLNFLDLLIAYESLEREKIINNGLAKLIQGELALKARTEREKAQAFEKIPLEHKNIIIKKLLEAA